MRTSSRGTHARRFLPNTPGSRAAIPHEVALFGEGSTRTPTYGSGSIQPVVFLCISCRGVLHVALRDRGEMMEQPERDEHAGGRLAAGIDPGPTIARVAWRREQCERDRNTGKDALAALATVQKEVTKLGREEAAVFDQMTKP